MTSRISWTVCILACSSFTLKPSICFSLMRPRSYPFATRPRSSINCPSRLSLATSITANARSPSLSLPCMAYNYMISLLRSYSFILPFYFNRKAYSSAYLVSLLWDSICQHILSFSLRYCSPSFLAYSNAASVLFTRYYKVQMRTSNSLLRILNYSEEFSLPTASRYFFYHYSITLLNSPSLSEAVYTQASSLLCSAALLSLSYPRRTLCSAAVLLNLAISLSSTQMSSLNLLFCKSNWRLASLSMPNSNSTQPSSLIFLQFSLSLHRQFSFKSCASRSTFLMFSSTCLVFRIETSASCQKCPIFSFAEMSYTFRRSNYSTAERKARSFYCYLMWNYRAVSEVRSIAALAESSQSWTAVRQNCKRRLSQRSNSISALTLCSQAQFSLMISSFSSSSPRSDRSYSSRSPIDRTASSQFRLISFIWVILFPPQRFSFSLSLPCIAAPWSAIQFLNPFIARQICLYCFSLCDSGHSLREAFRHSSRFLREWIFSKKDQRCRCGNLYSWSRRRPRSSRHYERRWERVQMSIWGLNCSCYNMRERDRKQQGYYVEEKGYCEIGWKGDSLLFQAIISRIFYYTPPPFSKTAYNPYIPIFQNRIRMQQSTRIKIFSKFCDSIKSLLTPPTMSALNQRYYIRQFKIWEIDTAIANNLYFAIVTRSRRTGEKLELGWVENQLRLFVWTLVLYAEGNGIDIQDLTEDGSTYDWSLFMDLFPAKPKELFVYQGKNLLKKHNQYKKWVHEQDRLFEALVRRDNFRLKWSDLGKALFIQSQRKYFRTPKQCRQRWLNHLDPSKLKKYWLEEEDYVLIQFVRLNGKKWAAISKKLENKRNQHSIKNRFKSLLTRESKHMMKPYDQQALVQAIYQKMLEKGREGKQEEQSRRQGEESSQRRADHAQNTENNDLSQDFESSYDSVSIFEQKSAQEQAIRPILNNISLNTVPPPPPVHALDPSSASDRQAFQFCKSSHQPGSQSKQWRRVGSHQSQMEKRIRADLFLQEDPFEMLRNYFYKHAQ